MYKKASINKNKNYEIVNDYIFDYDLFKVEEIIIIINFFRLIESTKTKKVPSKLLIEKHNEYRTILNNKSLEKQYDKMLFNKSQISIHKVINNAVKI